MHSMQLSGRGDLFENGALRFGANIMPACILASVINVETAKTAASFLTIC